MKKLDSLILTLHSKRRGVEVVPAQSRVCGNFFCGVLQPDALPLQCQYLRRGVLQAYGGVFGFRRARYYQNVFPPGRIVCIPGGSFSQGTAAGFLMELCQFPAEG